MDTNEIEKLARFVMSPGISDSDLCKFLALQTFSHTRPQAVWAGEITEDGYISRRGTFGIPAKLLSSLENIPLSAEVPSAEAVKSDKVIILKREESAEKYPALANFEVVPENWQSYVVCPVLPHGVISLALDSIPKVDSKFEIFLRTVGAITLYHFNMSQHRTEKGKHSKRNQTTKKLGELSGRQIAILHLIERGFSNPSIAEQIGYSESLVRQETMQIYSILKVSGRRELIERKKE